jgi:hypothetical protein
MNRMVGGTLGIAVIGAVFAAIAPAGVSDPSAFIDAFTASMWVATGVTAFGALVAVALLRGRAERPAAVEAPQPRAVPTGELAHERAAA